MLKATAACYITVTIATIATIVSHPSIFVYGPHHMNWITLSVYTVPCVSLSDAVFAFLHLNLSRFLHHCSPHLCVTVFPLLWSLSPTLLRLLCTRQSIPHAVAFHLSVSKTVDIQRTDISTAGMERDRCGWFF